MNYETAIAALITLAIVSIVLERALSVVFGWKYWKKYLDGQGLKTVVAVVVAFFVCRANGFDVFAMAFDKELSGWGLAMTVLFIAGGSKLVLSAIRQIRAFQQQEKA